MLPFKNNNLKSNFDLLKTCFLSNLNVNLFDDPWRTTTFIVPCNELQNAINHYMIGIYSKTSKQNSNMIVTIDTYKKDQYVMTSNTL
jgi:hypothetical protein